MRQLIHDGLEQELHLRLDPPTGIHAFDYLQYAHARICSILRKAEDVPTIVDDAVPLHPAERALTHVLDEFGSTLVDVSRTLEPHRLCAYLFGLAKAFSDFYENCPVLAADDPLHGNRLALCRLTAHTLQQGLELLKIAAVAGRPEIAAATCR